MRRPRNERKERHPPRKRRGSKNERGHENLHGSAKPTRPEDALRLAKPQTRELRRLLEGIGSPAPAPFTPDPFQLEALAAVEFEDVLVTAPTGSGKTWIAREEIRRLLESGRRAWYTSPLKALTNSKYQEFCDEFGTEQVGILTGDRKVNPKAPLIV